MTNMSSSNQAPPTKRSKGRQKVSMVKMENQSNLQVTFSKRRAGLFKKASELCTLCGAEAAIVVFSPAEKVYCFGHPNAKAVLDRFNAAGTAHSVPNTSNSTSQLIIEAHRNSTIRELNLGLTQVESVLRAERRRSEELELIRNAGLMQRWFPGSLDKFNLAQLRVLKESIIGFKKFFDDKWQKDMLNLNAYPLPYNYVNPPPHAGRGETPGWHFPSDGTYNAPSLSLDFNDIPSYGHRPMGFSSSGMFASGGTNISSAVHPAPNHPVASNFHDAFGQVPMVFTGGTNGYPSSKLPTTDSVGNGGFDASLGFSLGYGSGMFEEV